jgi:exonuclease VII small subunit
MRGAAALQRRDSPGRCRDSLGRCRDSLERCRDSLERCRDSLGRCRDSLERSRDSLDRSRDSLERSRDSLERCRDSLERRHKPRATRERRKAPKHTTHRALLGSTKTHCKIFFALRRVSFSCLRRAPAPPLPFCLAPVPSGSIGRQLVQPLVASTALANRRASHDQERMVAPSAALVVFVRAFAEDSSRAVC